MIKILANDGIHSDAVILMEEANYEVHTTKIAQEDLIKELPAYDVIIVRSATKVRKDLIDACPNLKVIARGGVGLDNIDVEYARSKGITVINTPAASSQSVAELVFAHMFSLARNLYDSNRNMPTRGEGEFKTLKKNYSKGVELRGKNLGIVGFGRIGQSVARIGMGIGMNIIAVDPFLDKLNIEINLFNSPDVALSVKVKTVEMDELLEKADFITLHVPFLGNPILSKAEFDKMKDGVILVHAARGGVVDEDALLEALESGKLAAAGLDVFINEPKPNPALLNHPRVSLSPHIGASTLEGQRNIGLELADKIIAYYGDDK